MSLSRQFKSKRKLKYRIWGICGLGLSSSSLNLHHSNLEWEDTHQSHQTLIEGRGYGREVVSL